ncbi:insulinase family protein [soil metagenome]
MSLSLKKILFLLLFLPYFGFSQVQIKKQYSYDSIPGDPLKARIYTLDNGLKVYLSVYKDEPRFYSMIGVKAGSKNDPSDHTGLAHYLEHMLFKGTDKYGSLDYAKEAPLLDSISNFYEAYGATTDSLKRSKIYHKIDSVSGEAAKFAIPNEFDKLMAAMGVTGTNAYTSVEETVYINNVPSNQIENFFKVEGERFRKPVMRIFHTELEAVYEEKNRGLDNDGRKSYEALLSGMFQNHQYGTQSTIGTVEHLKSPSLVAIKKFLDTYYVPNNMVIAVSGDFDPDKMIAVIDANFGGLTSKPIPDFRPASERLIKQPIVKEVYGPDAENILMGFRFGGANSEDADLLTIVDYILANGQAGLLDLNLNNSQKVLSSGSSTSIMKDYSMHIFSGRPREGQSLEDVRDLLLGQIMEMKNGNFPDWLIPAIITNLKLEQARSFEDNSQRASTMLGAETDGEKYARVTERINRLSKITKQQVIEFVRTWYGENYVIVYKRVGEDPNVVKVVKPQITPVTMNREQQSDFVKSVLTAKTSAIQPVFLDFNTAIKTTKLKNGIPVYMVQNTENNLFDLNYVLEMGANNNKKINLALQYLNYIGNNKYTSEQLKQEFYKIGCDYSASASEDEVRINISGIHENFTQAIILLESLLAAPSSDTTALSNLVEDLLKKRENAKLNKNIILGAMQNYGKFGAKSPQTNVLTEAELKSTTTSELCVMLRNLNGFAHRVDYYGPADSTVLVSILNKYHKTPRLLQAIPAPVKYVEQSTDSGKVFIVDYDMKQSEIVFLSKGMKYDKTMVPLISMYNRYFGGSMASPVFQTMRESKALAYSVSSRYSSPINKDRSYYNFAYIGTQVDKLPEAMIGMMELLKEFPESEKGFEGAKEGALQQIQAERITKSDIINTYHNNMKFGVNYDLRKDLYDRFPSMTLQDLKSFQEKNLKSGNYRIMVLGKRDKLDMKALGTYGTITELELKDLFGY